MSQHVPLGGTLWYTYGLLYNKCAHIMGKNENQKL